MAQSLQPVTVYIKAREKYFQRVQLCYDLISKPNQLSTFLQRCKLLDDTFVKFEAVNEQIEVLNAAVDEKERVDTLKVTKAFEELFFQAKAYEARIIEDKTAEAANASTHHETPRVKLPTITVPVFDGNITDFPSWKSLFDELVHIPEHLSSIQKFSYLKTYLKGSALLSIDTIAFTSANYPLAYKTLVDRYSKKRALASHFMNKLLDFQSLSKDSGVSLRTFLDHFHIVVESIRSLGIVNLEDFILLHLGLRVLDPKTTLEFEQDAKDKEFPTFSDLVNFVKNKVNILELNAESSTKPKSIPSKMLMTHVQPEHSTPDTPTLKHLKCSVCQHNFHKLSFCSKFKALPPNQRFEIVKNLKLCFGCFSATHSSTECTSKFSCQTCGSKTHHSLLHQGGNSRPAKHAVSGGAQSSPHNVSLQCKSAGSCNILLGTATIQIQDVIGNWIPVRCVVDPGSQISAITERVAQIIKLPRQPCPMQVTGIGSTHPVKSKGEIVCAILPHSALSQFSSSNPLQVRSVILPKIASDLTSNVPASVLQEYGHLQLADLSYTDKKISSHIDMLIGAEHYADLIISSHPIIQGTPSAIPTKLGWLLMGKVSENSNFTPQTQCTSLFISEIEDPVETQLQRFWEIEEVNENVKINNPEDLECEEHFSKTHSRDETGRYIVHLPFKTNGPPNLGSNQELAFQRLKSLTKRLDKNPSVKTLYQENLQTYLDAGHMVVAEKPTDYLLVHHGVYKETSSTTKLRVVFDPNTKGTNNQSLSDSLMVGPKLQSDIGDLLIAFRLNAIALTSDIQCMYRSIWLAKPDRSYQHILWHDNVSNLPIEYELTTVTFGLPSSPYQAQRVLKQLVTDEGEKYPLAASVVDKDIYVDDIITGGKNVSEVLALRNQLISLLGAGGFKLRKWASSNHDVIADLPPEECEMSHSFDSSETIKLLGVKWCPADDVFFFTVSPPESEVLTKRKVLSIVASIYDLNGYLSPVTVWMKVFMQMLWLEKNLSWDSPLSKDLQDKWNTFSSQLHLLSKIKLPRYILTENVKTVDLVGFADASGAAYGAVVYLRVCDSSNHVTTHLVRAKTRVAPLKVQTINRLELSAALLLVKVIKSLDFIHARVKINEVYLFSDSYTVLSWLKTQPFRLKIYVANRVAQILESTKPSQWRHVSTEKNSADPASRGLLPSQLVDNNLWFKGPAFLRSAPDSWPKPLDTVEQCLPELKPSVNVLVTETKDDYLVNVIQKFSSLGKLKRVMAYVLRFIHNLRKPTERNVSHLSVEEIEQSMLTCVKISQSWYLSDDLKAVEKGKLCSSNLQSLSPIINSMGILAVGGRLTHAPLPESAKHPILLPKISHLATLIVWDAHDRTLHGGPKVVQSVIQRQWWIIGGRNLIRQLLFKCIFCFKMKPKMRQPVMADIPISRYSQGRPFINVGIDFAGPFTYKTGPRRNSPLDKCYFAIFVCMATKCLHLELVSSLSTPAFLACLDRFVGRRGLPTCLFTDNGTNFQGAASYLKDVQTFLKTHSDEIVHHLHSKEIKWQFIPPSAPNFGGLWEAGVKSVKHHFRHVLEGHHWNFEELSTFLIRIEGILNSRPLCAISSNPNDGVDYLSPGHFLIGSPLLARPEHDFSDQPVSHLKRWAMITQTTQSFWRRWSKDYLNSLIQRSKWTKSSDSVNVNDIVIIQGQNLPTQKWPLGVVTKVMPGADGVTRVLELQTSKGTLIRPVSKVAVLPIEKD